MASLNLIPNIPVLLTQIGVFTVASYGIKKLIVQPYMDMKKMQQAATDGKSGDSQLLEKKCEEIEVELAQRIAAAEASAGEHYEKKVLLANNQAREMVAVAREQYEKENKKIRSEIETRYLKEKAQLHESLPQYSSELEIKIIGIA